MDECIGSLMPLYAFVSKLPEAYVVNHHTLGGKSETVYEALKDALYLSENYEFTWLLRPAFYDALGILYKAYKEKRIYGAFIFSNNSSQELVDFLIFYCNGWMARKFNDMGRPLIFKMGVCRDSPLRSPGSMIKSFSEIQRALAIQGLPMLENTRDLLFFDDMVHVLTGEIRNYIQVRPYTNSCPLERVIEALSGIESLVGSEVWNGVVKLAQHYQNKNDGIRYINSPPTITETIHDTLMFRQAFKRFLGQRAGAVRRTRKGRSSTISGSVRKNTLRRSVFCIRKTDL